MFWSRRGHAERRGLCAWLGSWLITTRDLSGRWLTQTVIYTVGSWPHFMTDCFFARASSTSTNSLFTAGTRVQENCHNFLETPAPLKRVRQRLQTASAIISTVYGVCTKVSQFWLPVGGGKVHFSELKEANQSEILLGLAQLKWKKSFYVPVGPWVPGCIFFPYYKILLRAILIDCFSKFHIPSSPEMRHYCQGRRLVGHSTFSL